jgi:argininosuccinate synthase
MRSVGSTESPRSEGAGFAGAEAGTIAALAYSGGLDTTCAIAWLKEDYGFDEVVAVMVDVGQEFDVEASLARGKAAGAADVLLVDRKAAFAGDQCAKAIQANALYENRYPLVSALSRPVVAQAVAEIAQEVGAEAVVHGCTGKGNDQLRFELAFKANFPGVRVIAPLRDTIWTRDAEIAYAEARGIPVRHSQASPYSTDENLFGRSIEAGILEDPWVAPPEDIYELTKDPATAPAPTELVVSFEQGVPVAVDGVELALPELIMQLNEQVGAYGVGRLDMIENRVVGIKSREIYEAPAAIALIEAHKALEDLVLTKDELRIKRGLEVTWTELVYEGLWFSPARAAIDAFVATTQQRVTGDVRLALSASSAIVAGRRSEFALYSEQLASYSTGETFPHQAAEGFITLQALEVELVAQLARGKAVV